ncbi:hypothetical protein [Bacillus cereus group sp. BfR-BA-01319]|uniref:hypothetical protein n=1 Tax=Bacillus cereus group sp. BfR-BA-01319 TaxID=2920296 RepID=UPI001F579537|nr:hypothetical protein [Bacillus cereus group sp. BfR-BA-01319]
MGKDSSKETKEMIGALLEENPLHNNTRIVFEALLKQGLITKDELAEMQSKLGTKKGLASC